MAMIKAINCVLGAIKVIAITSSHRSPLGSEPQSTHCLTQTPTHSQAAPRGGIATSRCRSLICAVTETSADAFLRTRSSPALFGRVSCRQIVPFHPNCTPSVITRCHSPCSNVVMVLSNRFFVPCSTVIESSVISFRRFRIVTELLPGSGFATVQTGNASLPRCC